MSNQEIARTLEEIADHLDFTGRARYPARAYRRAARSIVQLPVSVGALAMAGRARELRGIGASLEARIVELCETGTIAELERMRERTPPALMLLSRVRGVSRQLAYGIWETLEPRSLEDLAAAAEDGRLLEVPKVGPKTAARVRAGVATLLDEPERVAAPMLRTHAQRAALDIRSVLEAVVPGVRDVRVAGELARGHELVHVLDLLVVAEDAAAATDVVREQLDDRGWQTYSEDAAVSDECLTFALQGASGAGVRIHVTDEQHEGRSQLFAIGPAEHARAVRRRADDPSVTPVAATSDELDAQLHADAGLTWVPPELRDRPAVIALAERDALPVLVSVDDLRGELHCHSDWSDGRATIAAMADGALARGAEYLAITDHSQSLRIVNGLTHGDLAAQWRELEAVRATLPAGFALLQGSELEILPDGSLDFPTRCSSASTGWSPRSTRASASRPTRSPHAWIACGNCDACRHELYSLCENSNPNAGMAEKMFGHATCGMFGYSHLTGGFAGGQAEYARVPFADVGPFKVDDDLPDETVLPLTDIFPTGWMGAEMCGIRPGDVIAVWGAGPVGQFAIASAFLLGAERVIAIDRFDYRLRMARERGGAETLDYEQVDVPEALKELTGGRGPDACIDAVGMEAHHGHGMIDMYDRVKQATRLETERGHALREAIMSCRNGGTVSVIGVYGGVMDKFPVGSFMNRSLTMRGGQCHVQRYTRPLYERVRNGEIDPSFVFTHQLSLDEAPDGYETFKHKRDECMKVVLKP